MSFAFRQSENTSPEFSDTITARLVRLETATETLMAYVGYLTIEILKEQEQDTPNLARIQALELQKNALLEERRSITPDKQDLIAKALYVYAPIMKALDRHG